jgi:putative transposase
MLEDKATWYGYRIVVADRFYPSSKMCWACGAVKADLAMSERVFACEAVGL